MKTRILYTKIWKDEYYVSLNHKERNTFLYLFTNERVNLCGIYEITNREIKFDLNLSENDLIKIKEKFTNDDKFYFKDGWVKISNYEKYNNYSGDKNNVCKDKELALIPDFIKSLDRVSIPYVSGSDTTNNHKSEIINHKSELLREEDKTKLVLYLVEKGINKDLVVQEIDKFISYWTEKNHSGTKERWQLEKTFEIKKRLTTWFNNINKFGGQNVRTGRNFDS